MKRTKRLEPVQEIFSSDEKGRARELAASQQRLTTALAKLEELRRYHEDYRVSFERQARGGRGVAALRDFQTFLARLDQAVSQQEFLVERARDDLEAHTRTWQTAARKSRALDSVVERWKGEERRQEDRREQLQSDERAQRRSPAAGRDLNGEH